MHIQSDFESQYNTQHCMNADSDYPRCVSMYGVYALGIQRGNHLFQSGTMYGTMDCPRGTIHGAIDGP